MTKQEILERENNFIQMLNDVQSGKEVACPVCGKGVLKSSGQCIECSNEECDVRYTIN